MPRAVFPRGGEGRAWALGWRRKAPYPRCPVSLTTSWTAGFTFIPCLQKGHLDSKVHEASEQLHYTFHCCSASESSSFHYSVLPRGRRSVRSQLGPVLPTGWKMEPGQPGMTLGTRRMLSSTPEQSPPKKQIGTEVIAGIPSCCKLFKGPTCCEHPSSLGQIPNP